MNLSKHAPVEIWPWQLALNKRLPWDKAMVLDYDICRKSVTRVKILY